MFAKIAADYYGAPTRSTSSPGSPRPSPAWSSSRPYDKGSLPSIERAIRDSDLGVNPTNDGNIIRIVFPQLTEERRKDFIKVARHKAEDSRISIRNIRRHAKDGSTGWSRTAKRARTTSAGRRRAEDSRAYVPRSTTCCKHKETELLEVRAAARAPCRPVPPPAAGAAAAEAPGGPAARPAGPAATCPRRSASV